MNDEIEAFDLDGELTHPEKIKNRCVVRLSTSYWSDARGIHVKKTLRYIQKKCSGYNILSEDCSNTGVEDVIGQIVNLDECEDGVFLVVTCNEWSAWETPHIIEDYDYRLIPYTE